MLCSHLTRTIAFLALCYSQEKFGIFAWMMRKYQTVSVNELSNSNLFLHWEKPRSCELQQSFVNKVIFTLCNAVSSWLNQSETRTKTNHLIRLWRYGAYTQHKISLSGRQQKFTVALQLLTHKPCFLNVEVARIHHHQLPPSANCFVIKKVHSKTELYRSGR